MAKMATADLEREENVAGTPGIKIGPAGTHPVTQHQELPPASLDPEPRASVRARRMKTTDLGNGVTTEEPATPEAEPGLDLNQPRYPVGTWGYVNMRLVELLAVFPDGFLARGEAGDMAQTGWDQFRPLGQGAMLATAFVQKWWQDVGSITEKSGVDTWKLNRDAWLAWGRKNWLDLVDAMTAKLDAEQQKFTGAPGARKTAKSRETSLAERVRKIQREFNKFTGELGKALDIPNEVAGMPIFRKRGL